MPTERAFETGSSYPEREPGVVRLYSMRFCPYVKRTRLVLDHKNIPYEVVNINLKRKPEWYIENINCLGLVPSIETDDVIVFDSVIINEYLDSVYPENKLLHSDPYKAAKDKMLLEIWSKVVTAYYKVYYGKENEDQSISQMLTALDRVENELKQRKSDFFGGDKPMMIDFNMWPHMERLQFFDVIVPGFKLDTSRFKSITTYIEKMSSVPAAAKNKLRADWFKVFYETSQNGEPDYNVGLEE